MAANPPGRASRAVWALRNTASNVKRGVDGYRFGRRLPGPPAGAPPVEAPADPLTEYFRDHTEGPGLWKWWHYFPVYDRHLAKFIGREVHIVDVGIYSGGSLQMWHDYFGDGCHVHGVDIAPETRAYEREGVDIWIGDQADRAFWEEFKRAVPRVDVLVDDGGHEAHQQIATLKAILPHMAPGGVYICEDIHRVEHSFHSFLDGLTRNLSDSRGGGAERTWARQYIPVKPIHQHVASVHRYPLMVVIEKPDGPVGDFVSERRGTEWQPFNPVSSDRQERAN